METDNVVVAITGGARGIGRATAAEFVARGAKVAIGDIDAELAARTAVELGGGAIGLALDVTNAASFASFLDEVEERLGPLGVLVNNAGIMPTGPFLDESEALTDRQLDINLRGVINGCRLAGRRLQGRGGAIVNIASLAGATGFPGVATYSATKFAVVGLSEALRAEFAPSGVSVSVVLPGVVRTELSAGMQVPKAIQGLVTVDPEDVARAVVRAAETGSYYHPVPRPLGAVLAGASLLPTSVRRRLERATGFDQALLGADPEARRAYEQRITKGIVR